ncbi:MAG: hypothetical protein LBK63_11495, partial [Treponema sp.]|nr:hypothetical protein [Treponema sp.]
MAHYVEWFPTSRGEQLAMADDWIAVCSVNPGAWGIPSSAMTEFTARRDTARTALETAKNETTRT